MEDNRIFSKESLASPQKTAVATFAGGCFWCMQPAFDGVPGVINTTVGYAGGEAKDANYDKVSLGITNHKEAIEVVYDPTVVSYMALLEVYRRQIDPTDPKGQFTDKGPQYQTVIFVHTLEQEADALISKKMLAKFKTYKKPIVTQILPFTTFFPAEQYHQKYYKKSSLSYTTYKELSGRGKRIKEHSDVFIANPPKEKNPNKSDNFRDEEDLKKKLTPTQYYVTQQEGTEEAFENEYRDNERPGIYVDVISGDPLFSSSDKFDSGTGWPSFTKPISEDAISTEIDDKFGMKRIEARSSYTDAHLGHVFDDGPAPTGQRYCMNSAALEFIPLEQLEERGYGKRKDAVEQRIKNKNVY